MKRTSLLAVLAVLALLLVGCGTAVEGGLVLRTADPNLSIFIPVPQAVPAPDVEPEVVPEEEVGEVLPDPLPEPPCDFLQGDECLPVKGNISRSGEKIYHTPESPNYNQVKIDEAAGEAFFRTVAEAEAAGWRKAKR